MIIRLSPLILFKSCDQSEVRVCFMIWFRVLENSRARPFFFVSSATSFDLGDVPEYITITSKLFESLPLLIEILRHIYKSLAFHVFL